MNYTKSSPSCQTACWISAGIAAGIVSALVKSGVETLLPPRLPDVTPPPISLLEKMGLDASSMVYTFSDQIVNWGGNGVHILFSIVIALVYCLLASKTQLVTLWHGLPFGWIMAFGAHGIVLPAMGISPEVWDILPQGAISEVVGTTFWMWTIECVRREFFTCSTQTIKH